MAETGKFGKFCIFCTTGIIVMLALITAATLTWVWLL